MKILISKKHLNALKWIVIAFIIFKAPFLVLERFDMKNTIKEKSNIEISISFRTDFKVLFIVLFFNN